ncbi:recombinase family protein [Nitrosovibrio sp. Nv6]|uniref:recombinase family protein n=1 Tax=Nitrosovibrio sp. Nv6 TaxID=1855340 RepID=UPI003511CDD0
MAEQTAIIYARVSTSRQADDGLPIASQIEQGHKKAGLLGALVVRVFTDAGISGRTDERPAFRDAVAYCKAYGVDYFVCWSTSRFARNKLDAALYKRDLEKCGTRVVYVSVDLDNRTDSGWMMESMLEIFDEHYSRQVSADTLRSMIKNARDGYFNGGRVPFGYMAVPDGKRKRLAVLDVEAQIIRDLFGLYVEGIGCKAIAMTLNERARLRRGMRWNKNVVTATLKNEVYTGKVVFNRTDSRTGRARSREEWIITQSHPAIIEEGVFMSVQELFGERTPVDGGGSPHSGLVFTGLLRCGKCGLAMRSENGTGRSRRYHYYNCQTAQKGGGCENRRIAAPDLDQWLIQAIMDKVLTRERLVETISELHEITGRWVKDRARRREEIVKTLRDVESRLKKLFDVLELHGKDAPNMGDLTERLRELKQQRSSLDLQLVTIEEEEIPIIPITESDVQEMADLLRDIVETTGDQKKLRLFFSSFIDQIVVNDKGVRIEYRAEKLVNQTGFDTVRSKARWLPDQGSNLGPAD